MAIADVKATLLATEVRTLSAHTIPQDFRISALQELPWAPLYVGARHGLNRR
jgi:hypothetical protein